MDEKKYSDLNDADFEEINALIKHLRSLPREDDGNFKVDSRREEQVRVSFAYIKHALLETESYATIELDTSEYVSKGFGAITVKGLDLAITDMERFSRAIEFSDNMEVLPLVNGKVVLTLGFYGMATRVGGGG
jgi:hypothetical protein